MTFAIRRILIYYVPSGNAIRLTWHAVALTPFSLIMCRQHCQKPIVRYLRFYGINTCFADFQRSFSNEFACFPSFRFDFNSKFTLTVRYIFVVVFPLPLDSNFSSINGSNSKTLVKRRINVVRNKTIHLFVRRYGISRFKNRFST